MKLKKKNLTPDIKGYIRKKSNDINILNILYQLYTKCEFMCFCVSTPII